MCTQIHAHTHMYASMKWLRMGTCMFVTEVLHDFYDLPQD